MTENQHHLNWLNTLRCIATFSVIILHLSVPLVNEFDKVPSYSWVTGNIFDGLTRFCVPVFVMISGVLLLDKNYSIKTFLTKRMIKIIIPFLFWSMIYFLLHADLSDNPATIALKFIKTMKGGAEYHLWYIYMIIGIYLFLPIINKWIINSNQHEIQYFLILWLAVIILGMPYFNKLFTRIDFRYFSGYLGYAVLGYYLNRYFNTIHIKYSILLFLTGSIATIGLTHIFSVENQQLFKDFYNYLSPNLILQSTGIFLLCKNIVIKNYYLLKIISFISKYSFGIYLSHVFVLSILNTFGIAATTVHPVFTVLFTGIICLSISLFITYLLNKLPFGKYISG